MCSLVTSISHDCANLRGEGLSGKTVCVERKKLLNVSESHEALKHRGKN